jgi:outer membrane protein assembly factor BamB
MTIFSLSIFSFASASVALAAPGANPHRHIILFPTHQRARPQKQPSAGQQTGKTPPAPKVLGSGNLTYHGGPVEATPSVFLIFWGPTWNNGSNGLTSDGQLVQSYFSDVGSTSFENILSQYYDTNGSIPNTLSLAGTYLDFSTPSTDTSCGGPTVQDASIQAEVQAAITANGWPTNANATYFVFPPSNAFVNDGSNDCSDQSSPTGFCGYHGFSASNVPYAAIPYPLDLSVCPALATPNGSAAADSLVNISSHEQFEAISDPQLNAWYDASGFEIGDKCAYDLSAGLTHLNNGGTFAVQTEYSNASSSCVNTFSLNPSQLQFNPASVSLVTTPGSSPAPTQVTLFNGGTGSSTWSAGHLPPWVSVSPTSGTLASGASKTLTLTFSVPSTTSQTYSTSLSITDPNAIAPVALPVTVAATSASKTWYFAEGYTGSGFSEFLTLENPNASTNTATVQYFLGSGSPITKVYSLPPTSRTTLVVNQEVGPNQNVSLVVTGSLPLVAERPMYFTYTGLAGYSIPGGSDVLGATQLGQSFDFGYLDTTTGHDPYLTFLNSNNVAMNATIQYFPAAGGSPFTRQHTFAANSRGTINLRTQENLPQGSYSALVSLDQPGLVERPFYFQDSVTGYTGSADVVGVTTPQRDWYFAEGYTNTNFSERYYLSNPNLSGPASATVTFFLSTGTTQSQSVSIPAGGQVVVNANALLGNNVNNSAEVSASLPILAERFMSFDFPGATQIPGATDVLGTNSPSNLFYFAEGYTGTGFDEYLTIENPNPTYTASVTVTFYPESGAAPTTMNYAIVPSSRFTLFTANVMPNQSFSMQVESNVPIVAERPMYFNYLSSGQTGGSDVIGYQAPGMQLPASTSTVYAGSADGNEYALRAGIGSKQWSFQTGNLIVSRANVVNGIVYVGSYDNTLYALHASDGSVLWSYQTGGAIYSSPAVANGIVYVGSQDDFVYALNATTGAKVWSFQTGNAILSSPAIANGVVYIGSEDGQLYALNASNGNLVWSVAAGSNVGVGVAATPVVANGVVYVGSEDGNVYAFNATTGTKVWSFQTFSVNDVIDSSATLDSGLLYFGAVDGIEYVLNATTGALVWNVQVSAAIESSPVVSNGVLYFGADNGQVYALKSSDGTLYWNYQTLGPVYSDITVA